MTWKFSEWDGVNEIPLSAKVWDGVAEQPLNMAATTIFGEPNAGFTNDPGIGNKMYFSWISFPEENLTDLMSYRSALRGLSTTGYPANNNISPQNWRGYYQIANDPNAMFGSHTDGTWTPLRKACANFMWVDLSMDWGTAALAQSGYDGTFDTKWTRLGNQLINVYNKYGIAVALNFANEPDAWSNAADQCQVPLSLTRYRRMARYVYFFLINMGVPDEAFFIFTPSLINETSRYSVQNNPFGTLSRHKVPIQLTATSWPAAGGNTAGQVSRGDAMYYYHPDWKGTRTGNFVNNMMDPDPADWYQPGELDEWGYGEGPVLSGWLLDAYEKAYELSGGYGSRATMEASGMVTPDRSGNYFLFNKALYGGANPVLPHPKANNRGLPISIGEWGYGVMNVKGGNANADVTADVHVKTWMQQMLDNNVIALNKWRYVRSIYESGGVAPNYPTGDDRDDTFVSHLMVGSDTDGHISGLNRWDPSDSNSKAMAAMMGSSAKVASTPWPDGHERPPDHAFRNGFGDVE